VGILPPDTVQKKKSYTPTAPNKRRRTTQTRKKKKKGCVSNWLGARSDSVDSFSFFFKKKVGLY